MGFHLGLEGVDDLLGRIEMGMAQNLYQAVVAKLFLLRILGFVESVGIDEQRNERLGDVVEGGLCGGDVVRVPLIVSFF